jgi:Rrf2 family transcriptional regulator, iron-sulfur cluster assembly transcription factor
LVAWRLTMALLSKACEYGLRASLYVAAHGNGRAFVPIREIAEQLSISFHFLTKILQQLTDAGILKSYRGPRGGVALARPAPRIPLLDVVKALDGEELFRRCVLGLDACDGRNPCPLHGKWAGLRAGLGDVFSGAMIDELAGGISREEFRLTDTKRRRRGKTARAPAGRPPAVPPPVRRA